MLAVSGISGNALIVILICLAIIALLIFIFRR